MVAVNLFALFGMPVAIQVSFAVYFLCFARFCMQVIIQFGFCNHGIFARHLYVRVW